MADRERPSVPIYISAGDGPRHYLDTVTADPQAISEVMAAFLRDVADELERQEAET